MIKPTVRIGTHVSFSRDAPVPGLRVGIFCMGPSRLQHERQPLVGSLD